MKKIKHRTIYASLGAGWMTPQIQIQVTPLCWALEFMCQSTNGRPAKVAVKIGCFALVAFFGKGGYGSMRHFSNETSVTFQREESDAVLVNNPAQETI